MKGKTKEFIFCIILIFLDLAFIWGNSMLPARVSGQISNQVLIYVRDALTAVSILLEKVLGKFGYTTNLDWLGEYLIRKLGHFTEFCVLGTLLTELFILLGERGLHTVTTPLLLGVLTACADETIQKFVEGRGSSVVDVWIDTAGVFAGIILLYILRRILKPK